jgi:hypothetical protein
MTVLIVFELVSINYQQTVVVEMLAAGLHNLVAWLHGTNGAAAAFFIVHLPNNAHSFQCNLLFHLMVFLTVEVNGSVNDGVK